MVVQGGSAAGRERDEGVFMSRVSFDLVHTFPCMTPRLHAVLIWMVNSSIDTTLPAPAEQRSEHHMCRSPLRAGSLHLPLLGSLNPFLRRIIAMERCATQFTGRFAEKWPAVLL